MKSYLISDNTDTLVGMRLTGISGIVVHGRKESREAFHLCLKDKEIGILILTEKVFDFVKEECMEIKLKRKFPLIVEIPDRHGLRRSPDFITEYINDSIGISI
ncbi:MAG: V-type ATP synthase subunit F [Gallicola sp.]|nr:V-type ATP synthase subunit F [Gallicola sp.]